MKVLFVGPSLHDRLAEVRARFPALELRGPASRGDIVAAVGDGAEAIGLIDGCFGDRAAVWHKEILYALESGVSVGGGASMGALRAAECHALGMVGVGRIFRAYADGTILDDEAVAVAHAPAELDWMPLSVPWVNFEATVERARRDGAMDRQEAALLLLAGRHLHFTERTFRAAVALCSALPESRRAAIARLLSGAAVDLKREDAWAVAEWLAAVDGPCRPLPWRLARTSQWLALAEGLVPSGGGSPMPGESRTGTLS